MKEEQTQAKPVYEKPKLEVLGSLGGLTLFGINPNKWTSWADLLGGTAIADGGIGS